MAEESDSSCDFSHTRRTTGGKQPRASSNSSTPFMPRATKCRAQVPESSGNEFDERNAISSSKNRPNDSGIQEIKSMLHLCEKEEQNDCVNCRLMQH